MIFLKFLAFFAVLIGIGMLLMMIFASNATIVNIILIATVSIGALAIADLATFFIRMICKTDKLKSSWKSFISLLISSLGAVLIGMVFNKFLASVPFLATIFFGLSIILLVGAAVNLMCIALYLLFGTGKLTIPWKLFIFFLILTAIFSVVYIFSDTLSAKFLNGSETLMSLSLTALSVSIVLAIVSLLAAIINGIYSKNTTNALFKLFLSLIITAAALFGISCIFHIINKPWRNLLIFVSGVVLLVGVAVLIVIVFRVIFLNKPFYRNENYQCFDDSPEEDYNEND